MLKSNEWATIEMIKQKLEKVKEDEMQLFKKWKIATEAYNSFYEESEHLGLEVVTFLKHFSEANDTLSNAILKCLIARASGFQY